MPRRPNFNFERQQRDRDKTAKRDAKRDARAARKAGLPEGELLPKADPPPERTGTVDLRPTVAPPVVAPPVADAAPPAPAEQAPAPVDEAPAPAE